MTLSEFAKYKIGNFIPDKVWVKLKYFQWFHKMPNLENPTTYNEKLNWMKLYDHNPLYPKIVDKYEMKLYVDSILGPGYTIPVLDGPYKSFDEIDFEKLPDKFVLKTTHDCGGVLICDKSKFDLQKAKEFIEKHLSTNYYLSGREWPYKNVIPRVFVEEYMTDESSQEEEQLTDYKFFCFDGIPKFMFVATDRYSKEETKFDFYDMNYNHLDLRQGHPNSAIFPPKPFLFDEMKSIAERISIGFPHIRVDFYQVGRKLYIGELTLFHFSGTVPFEPEEWDRKIGQLLTLPKNKGD